MWSQKMWATQTVAEDPDEQLKFYSSSEAKTRLNNPIFSVSLLTEANIPISKQSKSLEYDWKLVGYTTEIRRKVVNGSHNKNNWKT